MTKYELCRKEQRDLIALIDCGKLIHVPCSIGSKVYYNSYTAKDCVIMTAVVFKIEMTNESVIIYAEFYADEERRVVAFTCRDFDEIVYLSYTDAEKGLSIQKERG